MANHLNSIGTEVRRIRSRAGDQAILESLEGRRLLSSSTTATGPSSGTILHEQPGVSFTADLGTFVTLAPGTGLVASIKWGDGATSKGTLVADGTVGLDEVRFEVEGTHTYADAGTFKIAVTVKKPAATSTGSSTKIASFSDTAIVAKPTVNTVLTGTITGTLKPTPTPVAADITAEELISGTGTAGVLGSVIASGDLLFPGPSTTPSPVATSTSVITADSITGTLILTTVSTSTATAGSVTLKLTEPAVTTAASSTSAKFHYVITGGTGAYSDASGSGTIAATFGSATDPTSFTFVITSATTGVAEPD